MIISICNKMHRAVIVLQLSLYNNNPDKTFSRAWEIVSTRSQNTYFLHTVVNTDIYIIKANSIQISSTRQHNNVTLILKTRTTRNINRSKINDCYCINITKLTCHNSSSIKKSNYCNLLSFQHLIYHLVHILLMFNKCSIRHLRHITLQVNKKIITSITIMTIVKTAAIFINLILFIITTRIEKMFVK